LCEKGSVTDYEINAATKDGEIRTCLVVDFLIK
jgi:hypothetical protein